MKKIKITEAQAKMLKEMGDTPKNKLLKVTESQYQKILEMEAKGLKFEDEMIGVNLPTNKIPSNAVSKNFEKGLNKGVKKDIGKIYENFLNELYGINEDGGNTYESLIKLMEVAGLIQNGKITRSKFNNNKDNVRAVMCRGLSEMVNGASHYKVMETIENAINEGGYPAGAEHDPNAPWNEPDYESEPEEEQLRPTSYPFKMVHYNPESDGFTLFERNGNLFAHISGYHDGEMLNDFCGEGLEPNADCINNFINYLATEDKLKIGLNPFKDLLAIIRPENKDEIIKYYGDDDKLMNMINGVDEMTSAGSSGSFVGPMALNDKQIDEVTTTTSVGGSNGSFAYDAPAGDGSNFWNAGNKLNKKGKGDKLTKGTPISVHESSEERYVAEMDFYIWASSDDEAKQQAANIVKYLNDNYDNRANITSLSKQKFGTMDNTPINESHSNKERYTTHITLSEGTNSPNKDVLVSKLLSQAKKMNINLQLKEDAQKDTQYPGGGFVELDDCTKLNNNKVAQNGGCSQGAIDNVVTTKSTSKSVVAKESVYEAVAKQTGKTIEEVKIILNKSN